MLVRHAAVGCSISPWVGLRSKRGNFTPAAEIPSDRGGTLVQAVWSSAANVNWLRAHSDACGRLWLTRARLSFVNHQSM